MNLLLFSEIKSMSDAQHGYGRSWKLDIKVPLFLRKIMKFYSTTNLL
jgi:hypothetical protein